MTKEVVRQLAFGIACGLLLMVLGFLPVWISASPVWSASRTSDVAMPVGSSDVSDVAGPLKIAKNPTVLGDPSMHP